MGAKEPELYLLGNRNTEGLAQRGTSQMDILRRAPCTGSHTGPWRRLGQDPGREGEGWGLATLPVLILWLIINS